MESKIIFSGQEKLAKYWASQNFKIYVVNFSCSKNNVRPESRYIQIKSASNTKLAQSRAVKVARSYSFDFNKRKTAQVSVRLAHPVTDLHCTWGGEAGTEPL